jgi:transmembrane sensor
MPDRPEFDGIDAELIVRYLSKETSEDETILVRRWLMAHPEAADRLRVFLARLDDEAVRPIAPSVDAEWNALQARVRAHEGEEYRVVAPRSTPTAPVQAVRRSSRWRRAGAIAAAASVVLAAALTYALVDRVPKARPSTADRNTYVTGAGERSDLLLADGTRVRLAPGSQVRVAADFGAARRDVYLDGEGYFEVTHDESRPFTVYAGNTSVRDIGTAFSVRSYAADSAVQVVVREGEVAVAGVGRLRAGDMGRVSSTGEATVRRADRRRDAALLDLRASRLRRRAARRRARRPASLVRRRCAARRQRERAAPVHGHARERRTQRGGGAGRRHDGPSRRGRQPTRHPAARPAEGAAHSVTHPSRPIA